jgi:hypothetical protein
VNTHAGCTPIILKLLIYLNQSNANCQFTAKNGGLGGNPGAEVLGASVEISFQTINNFTPQTRVPYEEFYLHCCEPLHFRNL